MIERFREVGNWIRNSVAQHLHHRAKKGELAQHASRLRHEADEVAAGSRPLLHDPPPAKTDDARERFSRLGIEHAHARRSLEWIERAHEMSGEHSGRELHHRDFAHAQRLAEPLDLERISVAQQRPQAVT